MKSKLAFCSCVLATSCLFGAETADVEVSPDGPIPSPAAALTRVRDLRRQGTLAAEKTARIVFAPGTYRLDRTLTFGPEDGNVAFVGTPGKTVFSGGVELDRFSVGADGIWRAKVPDGLVFEQLWVNGARATRARSPNKGYHYIREKIFNGPDPYQPDRTLELDNRAFGGRPEDVAPFAGLSRDETTNILVTVYYGWDTDRLHVYHADAKTGHVLFLTRGGRNFFMWPTYMTRYTVENFRGALDAPGEWFLDRAEGLLLYLPRPGEKPETTVAVAPCTEKLLVLKGAAGCPVRNVSFEDIAFTTAGCRFPTGIFTRQAAFRIDATVEMNDAEDIRFDRCSLRQTGLHGLSVGSNCRGVAVRTCLFEDLGGGGVWIGGRVNPPAGRETRDVTVADSIIAHTSQVFPEGTAVAVTYASDVKIVHNEIADIGYSGVSVGYVWGYGAAPNRNNLVGWNHIHHLGRATMSDMAGIYTLGDNRGTRIVGNVVHDIVSYDYTGAGGEGLYADEGSRGVTWESNLVYRTKGGSVNINYAMENVFRNNLLINPGCGSPDPAGEAFFRDYRTESHLTAVFTNNIGYSDLAVAPRALSKGSNGGLLKQNVRLGGNLYWSKKPFSETAFTSTDWESWAATGRDPASVVADPLFVDPAKDDWRLKPESPAFALGFTAWNFADAGVRGDAAWQAKARSYHQQPTPAMPTVPPLFGGVKAYASGFEEFSVGAQLPTAFGFSSSGGQDLVRVTDKKVRHGKRAVEAVDEVSREPSYLPHFYTKPYPAVTNGLYRYRFSIALESDNDLALDWRDDDYTGGRHTFETGLGLRFVGGAVKVNGVPALTLADGEWCDVEIVAHVSPERAATFDVTLVGARGERKILKEIAALSKNYRKVTWTGFLSYAKKDTRWYLDDFSAAAEAPEKPKFDTRAAQVACPVSARKGGHENTEWSRLYAYHMTDEKCQLPRFLIIGDSIVQAIDGKLGKALDGRMAVTSWASSYCVTCPEYKLHLEAVLASGRYDVIQFNNGLHSLSCGDLVKWAQALKEALLLVRCRQPQAKLVWATTSPLRTEENSVRARRLNAAGAKVVAELGGIVTNDVYAFLDPFDREKNWKPDGFHHQPPLQEKLARHIAEFAYGLVK